MSTSDFSTDPDVRRRIRARRRRRRVVTGAIKFVFWTCILAGVFVFGLGYGRTLSGDSDQVNERVTIEGETRTIEASLPAQTVTVTRTVKVAAVKLQKRPKS